MKKKIKNYLVFTSRIYRLITFVLVPVALILVQIILPLEDMVLRTFFIALLYPIAEVVADYWVFGGIAVRGTAQAEYIKTSERGISIIRTALVADMLRWLVTTVLLFVACMAVHACMGGTIEPDENHLVTNLLLIVTAYFSIVSECTIVRHLDGLQANLLVSCFATPILLVVMYLGFYQIYLTLAVMLLLSVVSSILGVKMVLKRVKESYYDKAA